MAEGNQLKLPDHPADLVEVAINDLEKIANTKGYVVDMTTWHEPRKGKGVCQVCLAGSVMAGTLGVPRDVELTPADFMIKPGKYGLSPDDGRSLDLKLEWLDMVRCSNYVEGDDCWGDEVFSETDPNGPKELEVFISEGRELVKHLRKGGKIYVDCILTCNEDFIGD